MPSEPKSDAGSGAPHSVSSVGKTQAVTSEQSEATLDAGSNADSRLDSQPWNDAGTQADAGARPDAAPDASDEAIVDQGR